MSENVSLNKYPLPTLEALVKCLRIVCLGPRPVDLRLRFNFLLNQSFVQIAANYRIEPKVPDSVGCTKVGFDYPA